MPIPDFISDDLRRAAELCDLAEELREAATTTGKHPASDRVAGRRYLAAAERLEDIGLQFRWRAKALAPPRTPRPERAPVEDDWPEDGPLDCL